MLSLTIAPICLSLVCAQSSQWQALDQGLPGVKTAAAIWNDTLYVSSLYDQYQGVLCKWDGARWDTVARMETDQHFLLNAMVPFQGDLYLLGYFEHINHLSGTKCVVRWDGDQFHGVGNGLANATLPNVLGGLVYDQRLYIWGSFSTVGNLPEARYLASWNGSQWKAELPDFTGGISQLTTWDEQLVAIGDLDSLGGEAINTPYLIKANDGWTVANATGGEWVARNLRMCTEILDPLPELWCYGSFIDAQQTESTRWMQWIQTNWQEPATELPHEIAPNGISLLADDKTIIYGYDANNPNDPQSINHIFLKPSFQGKPTRFESHLDGTVNWMLAVEDTVYAAGNFAGARNDDGSYIGLPNGMAKWYWTAPTDRKQRDSQIYSVRGNGTQAELSLSFQEPFSGQIEVYDLTGQQILSISCFQRHQQDIAPSGVSSGIYLVRLQSKAGMSESFRWRKH